MMRFTRAPAAFLVLLPALLAGTACTSIGSGSPAAILERVADGDYDIGIRYPSKRTRYVMIVEDNEDSFALVNRPAAGSADVEPSPVAVPAVPQSNDRVLAPCAEATGNWYRHTPAGFVCVGGTAAPGTGN